MAQKIFFKTISEIFFEVGEKPPHQAVVDYLQKVANAGEIVQFQIMDNFDLYVLVEVSDMDRFIELLEEEFDL